MPRALLAVCFLAGLWLAAPAAEDAVGVVRLTHDGSFKQHLHFAPDGKPPVHADPQRQKGAIPKSEAEEALRQ